MKTFGWHWMDIALRGHYAFMSWYVQPATAPVSYRDYLKHELHWHGCITHVICSFKNFPSLPTRFRAFFCHWLCYIFFCATQSVSCSQLILASTFFYSIIFIVWHNVLMLNHKSKVSLPLLEGNKR